MGGGGCVLSAERWQVRRPVRKPGKPSEGPPRGARSGGYVYTSRSGEAARPPILI